MIKKISAEDFNYIWETDEAHRKLDWSRAYTMRKMDNGSYRFCESTKIWLFILLYLPASIMAFFACLWDGGLREFRLPDVPKKTWWLSVCDKKYIEGHFNRADKVWERA